MALPLSGQISMSDIRFELGVLSQSPFGLNEARSGTYVAINSCSTFKPPSTGQIRLSDWYGYDHTEPCPTPTPTPTITPPPPTPTPTPTPTPPPSYNYYFATQYLDCIQNSAPGGFVVRTTLSPASWICGTDDLQYQITGTASEGDYDVASNPMDGDLLINSCNGTCA